MDQGTNVSNKMELDVSAGGEEEIYCICRSSDVSRFM